MASPPDQAPGSVSRGFSAFGEKITGMVSDFRKGIDNIEQSVEDGITGTERHTSQNRFQSFAPQRIGNDIKWFVDGCGYFWAVSVALEEAKESIWILDWWLSPELYLRRPPSANEQYRLDRMLLAAAERGVKVNIIVYKEVSAILTCEGPSIRTLDSLLSSNSGLSSHQACFGKVAPQYCCVQAPRPYLERPSSCLIICL